MTARGFKQVGWVAAVGGAALGCYMLSLNVAAERAELAKLEWQIVSAKRDIRTLQTELGTRGRLQQLEHWNANVLALSAPTAAQFLDNELTLARFDRREKTVEERVPVQMASAEAVPAAQPKIAAPVHYAAAGAPAVREAQPLVHRAAMLVPPPKPAADLKPPAEPTKAPEAKPAEPKKLREAKAAEPKLASLDKAAPKKAEAKPAPAKKPSAIDDKLVKAIRNAESEKAGSAGGQ